MNQLQKVIDWLEISAYPEQAEIVNEFNHKYQKLLEFVKRVASGCNGEILEFLCELEDEAEELLKEIGELK